MTLFKKKNEKNANKFPSDNCSELGESIKNIKVLGSGCSSCHALYENTVKAAATLGLSVKVEYVTDLQKVLSFGIMSFPALVINNKVASVGRVLKVDDLTTLIKKYSENI